MIIRTGWAIFARLVIHPLNPLVSEKFCSDEINVLPAGKTECVYSPEFADDRLEIASCFSAAPLKLDKQALANRLNNIESDSRYIVRLLAKDMSAKAEL